MGKPSNGLHRLEEEKKEGWEEAEGDSGLLKQETQKKKQTREKGFKTDLGVAVKPS